MKNSKKSIYNIVFGVLSQLVMITVGVIFPRLILIKLGSESNGLTNSVSQIFTYFTLLEAGVGTASLQALYGPVGRSDYKSINEILAATDRYYKRTGIVYFIAFITLALIYPLLVDSELSKSTIFWVIIFTGFSGVISYFFQGKYNVLLLAEGKNYINNNMSTIVYIFTSIFKLLLLLGGFGIVAIQAMYCLFNLLKMVYIEWYIHRNYKWINLKVCPNKRAISQSSYVLVHQISSLIFNNTDTIVLTFMVGLKSVSVYSMYTLLFGMIGTAVGTITGGVQFILGQTFNNNRKRYLKLHSVYEIFSMVVCFSLYCVACIFILPFMELYTRGIDDVTYVDSLLPYLFVTFYLLSNGRESSNITIKFASHFKQTINRTIIESIINLTFSIVFVWKLGIYGVLIGSIVAILYRANDMILYANCKILHISPRKTYERWIRNVVIFIVITIISKKIPMVLDSYIKIIGWAVVVCVITVIVFVTVNLAFEPTVRSIIKEEFLPKIKKVCLRKR